MDLTAFAAEVGDDAAGPVSIAGSSSRGGAVAGVRTVHAPEGIDWVQADEMIVHCGAGTTVAELSAALAEQGQAVALPAGGTVGGALAVGRSGPRRLGDGHVRDVLLQTRYVSAAGEVVCAGGPTVKNVTGFDLCRLLVGSWGTLGFLGDVILRTRPVPAASRWFAGDVDPWELAARLYRPTSMLWDGQRTWVLLEGHPADIDASVSGTGLGEVGGPPPLPRGGRWSMTPADLRSLTGSAGFVAEIGVGVVHHTQPAPRPTASAPVLDLHRRLKQRFDPTGRLNPGVDVLTAP